MLIHSLEARNYRRFERLAVPFDPRFTLLAGPNGSGKTSILQAAFIGIAQAIPNWAHAQVEESEVRRTSSLDPGGSAWRSPNFPSEVRVAMSVDDIETTFVHTRNATGIDNGFVRSATGLSDKGLLAHMRHLGQSWTDPAAVAPVPVLARFGAAVLEKGAAISESVRAPFADKSEIFRRFARLEVHPSGLVQWFQYNELRTLQEKSSPLAYRAARSAVLGAIHADEIQYIVRDNQLMLRHNDQGWRPFDELSDGQRRIAALFCELALRCSSLNSHLGERCIVDSPGIVLIDELDLHLHPLWQRSVIDDLCRTFPKIQFIAASHSPFLLQSALDWGAVLDVSKGRFVNAEDRSIEDIAEELMGVELPQRSARFNQMRKLAQDYYELLERPTHSAEEEIALKGELDAALAPFADDPAAAAWLAQRRLAAGR